MRRPSREMEKDAGRRALAGRCVERELVHPSAGKTERAGDVINRRPPGGPSLKALAKRRQDLLVGRPGRDWGSGENDDPFASRL